jgi:ATP-dependent helicase/nuclease subunit B
MDGPTIPSRFLSRIEALLGENSGAHREQRIGAIAAQLDRPVEPVAPYPRPQPDPSAELRDVPIKVTALDRLLGDPYQFYASEILKLRVLDPLDAEATPALQGTLAHKVLEEWHKARESDANAPILPIANKVLAESNLHPLTLALWRPRLYDALEWVAQAIAENEADGRKVVAVERKGSMIFSGVRVYGRADRIDRMADGTLAVVDYKTGKPPSAGQVAAGFALQLGLLGLIAREGDFDGLSGEADCFEYWSLSRNDDGGFGYADTPMKVGNKRSGLPPEDFLPEHEKFLGQAIARFIKGSEPFKAKENPDYKGYADYDQLMRLDEWLRNLADDGAAEAGEA